MDKTFAKAIPSLLEKNGWKRLANPSVTRGVTAVPKNPTAAARIGLRLDYNGFVEKRVKFHQFKLQVNAGDTIPTSFKNWRNSQKRGMHAVMATVEIRDGTDKDEVEFALRKATKNVRGV